MPRTRPLKAELRRSLRLLDVEISKTTKPGLREKLLSQRVQILKMFVDAQKAEGDSSAEAPSGPAAKTRPTQSEETSYPSLADILSPAPEPTIVESQFERTWREYREAIKAAKNETPQIVETEPEVIGDPDPHVRAELMAEKMLECLTADEIERIKHLRKTKVYCLRSNGQIINQNFNFLCRQVKDENATLTFIDPIKGKHLPLIDVRVDRWVCENGSIAPTNLEFEAMEAKHAEDLRLARQAEPPLKIMEPFGPFDASVFRGSLAIFNGTKRGDPA